MRELRSAVAKRLALGALDVPVFPRSSNKPLQAVGLLAAGILANLAGDIVFLNLATQGVYVEGGPLDLSWLLGVSLMAGAAHISRPGRRELPDGHPFIAEMVEEQLGVPTTVELMAFRAKSWS